MSSSSWPAEFPASIVVCDPRGIILEMNPEAVKAYADQGGAELIGSNLLDCHPEPSRSRVQEMLRSEQANVYTIERGGRRKLIYQSPWYRGGRYAGLVELALELPAEMPHFVRDPS